MFVPFLEQFLNKISGEIPETFPAEISNGIPEQICERITEATSKKIFEEISAEIPAAIFQFTSIGNLGRISEKISVDSRRIFKENFRKCY